MKKKIKGWENIKNDIHSDFRVMLHATLLNAIHKRCSTIGEVADKVVEVIDEYSELVPKGKK